MGEQAEQRAEQKFPLGILFVHGIGTQSQGETLSAFGTPLVQWIADRFRGMEGRWVEADVSEEVVQSWRNRLESEDWPLASDAAFASGPGEVTEAVRSAPGDPILAGRVTLGDTLLGGTTDPLGPAHSEVRIQRLRRDAGADTERWLMAESWWAETFPPPTFPDLARWILGIVPWTLGSHYAAHVRRSWRERPSRSGPEQSTQSDSEGILGTASWAWRLTLAAARLFAGIVLSVLLLPLLGLLLLLGLIPIGRLRSALLGVQLRLAAILGDSFVLLANPMEAAAIVTQVQSDLEWLTERCDRVAIVAHSQGAAVTHLALQRAIPAGVRLVFTFGSGLRKLEELRELMERGKSFASSALTTSLALPLLVLFVALPIRSLIIGEQVEARLWLYGLLATLGASTVVAIGLRDHLRGIDLPGMKRWVERLGRTGLWTDCYSTADPVPNGPILPEVRALSVEVCNEGSVLRDHNTYWANQDEFIGGLMNELSRSEGCAAGDEFASTDAFRAFVARHRRWRTRVGKVSGWTVVAFAVAALAEHWRAWWSFFVEAWRTSVGLFVGDVGWGELFQGMGRVDGMALFVGVLAAVVFLGWRWMQRGWNRDGMASLIGAQRVEPGRSAPLMVAIPLLIAYGAAFLELSIAWGFVLGLAISLALVLLEPEIARGSASVGEGVSSKAAGTGEGSLPPVGRQVSGMERARAFVVQLFVAVALPFALGMAAWDGLVWLIRRLPPDVQPSLFASGDHGFTAGVVVAVVTIATVAIRAARSRSPGA